MNNVTLESMKTGKAIKALQVAPGEYLAPEPKMEEIPRFGIYRLVPKGDGTFRPVFDCAPQRVRVTDDLPRQLGLPITSTVLKILCAAGFVDSSRPTPRILLMDLASLSAHLESAEDPGFWNEDRMSRYSQAKQMIAASGKHKDHE